MRRISLGLVLCLLAAGCAGNVTKSSSSTGGASSADTGVAGSPAMADDDKGGGENTATPNATESGTTVSLNGDNTKLQFVGSKAEGSHDGGFKELDGKLVLDDQTVQSLTVTIKTDSLWSDDEKLTTHLKSPDFFNVNEHPEAKFESTSVTAGANGQVDIKGNLTLLGTTKEVSMPATVSVQDGAVTLNSEFTIDRTQFGMTYGEGKVNAEVKITVAIQG